MSEAINYVFTHKEIAELLIKKQGIHEGFWAIAIEFGLGAANIATGPDDPNILPAAIVSVRRIGIQRHDQPNQLTVDASQINPVMKKVKKK